MNDSMTKNTASKAKVYHIEIEDQRHPDSITTAYAEVPAGKSLSSSIDRMFPIWYENVYTNKYNGKGVTAIKHKGPIPKNAHWLAINDKFMF